MTSTIQTLLFSLLTIILCVVSLWLLSVAWRDVSIIDVFWGTGFSIVALLAWGMNGTGNPRTFLLVCLTVIWGTRLSLHLYWRKRGHGEDHRYAAMREHRRRSFWWTSLGGVFLLQGIILWFVSFPVQCVASGNSPTSFGWIDVLGLCVWLVGMVFETVGDWQLSRFRADKKNDGRVLDSGLWRFTRHPNYFGDFCVWWGLYLIAVGGGSAWTIASPLLMSFLLLNVSGVKLLESNITDRRPEYAAYQSRTNAFFPGLPRMPNDSQVE